MVTFLHKIECWPYGGNVFDLELRVAFQTPNYWTIELSHAELLGADLEIVRCLQPVELGMTFRVFLQWLGSPEALPARKAIGDACWAACLEPLPVASVPDVTQEEMFPDGR